MNSRNIFNLIIIGAGPAGLMAAGTAGKISDGKLKIAVLEKMPKTSLKLGITGKGRCNITNNCSIPEFLEHTSKNGKFLRQAFSIFFAQDIIAFLNKNGVATTTERGRRVFPTSGKAKDVVVAINNWVKKKRGVQVFTGKNVSEIILLNEKDDSSSNFKLIVNKNTNSEESFFTKKLIISTGGMSYPLTGSTGAGYQFAEKLGHKIEKLYPVLVPLVALPIASKEKIDIVSLMEELNKVELRNVTITVWIDGKKKRDEFGELVFTKTGLTGPIILKLSREFITEIVDDNVSVVFSLDLKPALDTKKLDLRLIRELEANNKKNFSAVLNNLLPKKLDKIISSFSNITLDRKCHSIVSKDRKNLLRVLKSLEFSVSGYSSFNEAIVTKGGIKTSDIYPKTMESKIIANLYFAGEIIDLDADTGGYNLQIAFSTGYSAGLSAGGE